MTEEALFLSAAMGQTQGGHLSIWGMLQSSGYVARVVLAVLCGFSIVSWGIIVHKLRLFSKISGETITFMEVFKKRGQLENVYNHAKRLRNCPMAKVFLAGYIELAAQFRLSQVEAAHHGNEEGLLLEKLDSVGRSLERATAQEVTKLERWLIFLGTTGSVTPFIGLFGTVWGVMMAFSGIGAKGVASVAVVAPGISEALIATAAGLFTAVPAVMGYNYFIYQVKIQATDMDNFSLDMLSLIDRIYIKRSG
ncbi:MAG: MotA/TolQ/ExbB proton channel family protein [Nitrospinota bacterium]|nr:MotA/TolQ/ExbB proton channel family protein [Nitrospinota bacterium]MDH5755271.1 MotA/TolQ/ExbB proton channel family protein [Nitrospinota bacterium]